MKGIELKSVDVKARLVGGLANVALQQWFVNSGKESFELTYMFPVPPDAKVSGFTIKLGDRNFQSQIEETEDAFQTYDKAIRKGDSAGMIEALRKDILQLTLGNILPGEEMTVSISYHQELKVSDNEQELDWRIPFVVAPRYSRTKDKQSMSIQPNLGDNHTVISLEAEIVSKKPFLSISSPSHPIEVSTMADKTIIRLAKCNEKPDSDFVLHLTMDKEPIQVVYTESDPEKGTFSLLQLTPVIEKLGQMSVEKPRTYGFVLDHSGSMEGDKLAQAKLALKLCLRQLSIGDKFTIIAFDDQYLTFSKAPQPYTQASLEEADSWIDQIAPAGGTEIFAPLSYLFSVLDPKSDNTVLLFTDGQVTDEKTIVDLVIQQKGLFELFPFGIDTAVNQSFIDEIAREGNGIAEYIYPGERIEDKVLRQFDRIHAPFWENPRVVIAGKTKGQQKKELKVYPNLASKMFAGETYRVLCQETGSFELKVLLDGKEVIIPLPKASKLDPWMEKSVLASWWALNKIRDLERYLGGSILPRRKSAIQKEIVNLSKEFGVLSTLTSLVAVMPRIEKAKGMPTLVDIPICAPKGWDMLKNLRMNLFVGGLPEAEPCGAPAMPYQMTDQMTDQHFTKGAKKLEPQTISPIKALTLDDIIRSSALKQKANGSLGEGQESVERTMYFILGLLASGNSIQRYGKAILKAVDFLLSQDISNPLAQACILQWILTLKMMDTTQLKLRLKECLDILPSSEKIIFDQFVAGSYSSFWSFMDKKLSDNNTNEEIATFMLKSFTY